MSEIETFDSVLNIIDTLPGNREETPLRDIIPGAYPTVSELRELVKKYKSLQSSLQQLQEENRVLKAEIMICAKALANIADSHDNPESARIARDALGTVPKQYAERLKAMERTIEDLRVFLLSNLKGSNLDKGLNLLYSLSDEKEEKP